MIPPSAQLGMDNELAREVEMLRKQLAMALVVVNAARKWRDAAYRDKVGNSKYCGCHECALVDAVCTYDSVQPEAKQLTDA